MNVLLIGPSSYLGRRLAQRLLESDTVSLRLLVRDIRRIGELGPERAEIVEGDVVDKEILRRALAGIDVAYFPIRFLGTDRELIELGKTFAERFRDACIEAGVKRIVYLGVPAGKDAGDMRMRTLVDIGEILSSRPEKILTIWFRAGFVIGSGSPLFEALRNLVRKSPVLPIPRWMELKINPLGVGDVLEYLTQAKDLDVKDNVLVDIGMEEVSFREMLKITARLMGLRRFFIPLPFSAYWISPLVVGLLTPFPFSLASLFVRTLRSGDILRIDTGNNNARRYFPGISPASIEKALEDAVSAIEQQEVISRWTDSLTEISYAGNEYDIAEAVFRDEKEMGFGDISPHRIFRAVKSIGGRQGWFSFDILWRVRGLLDKLAGGYGTSVGKRVESDLRVGDMLDVWEVVDLDEDRRLLLEAKMKVFGKAWLEFRIEGNTLIQTAYHHPKGLMGRLYWYSMFPFHVFIFRDMISNIVRRAGEED